MQKEIRNRGWVFTLNNYTEEDIQKIDNLINIPRPQISYLIYGKEIAPTTNTPHLQGYIHFKNQQTFSTVKRHMKKETHIEPQRGTNKQAIDYCKEDGDYKEFGEEPEQGTRTDLNEVYERLRTGTDIDEIIMENPDVYNRAHRAMHKIEDIALRKKKRTEMTLGEWIYGDTGLGKSEYAYNYPDLYSYPYDNGWCDGYKQQEVFVIDEFRGQIPFNEILRMVDKHPNYSVRRRGREPMPFTSKRVVITSSLPPYKVFKHLEHGDSIAQLFRRFKIYKLTKAGLEEETFADYQSQINEI